MISKPLTLIAANLNGVTVMIYIGAFNHFVIGIILGGWVFIFKTQAVNDHVCLTLNRASRIVFQIGSPLETISWFSGSALRSSRGWITAGENTLFFCHRFNTRTILPWNKDQVNILHFHINIISIRSTLKWGLGRYFCSQLKKFMTDWRKHPWKMMKLLFFRLDVV